VRGSLYDARFAKPVDGELIERLVAAGTPILTVEDHSIEGGFGQRVVTEANRRGLDTRLIHILAIPDRWVYQDSRGKQLAEVGLDAAGIARAMRAAAAGEGTTTETAELAQAPSPASSRR